MSENRKSIALVRYSAVSLVLAKVRAGMTFSLALAEVAKTPLIDDRGRRVSASVRTLQRWIAAFQSGGFDALQPASRRDDRVSRALSDDFLTFLVAQKKSDPDASIPEVIRRAARRDVLSTESLSRSTVWRAAKRLNLPIFASKGIEHTDMRRYAYPHRLQMVLADGKYFRAGIKSRRRVVITFLDDATRFGLGAVVGKSESSHLFLAGLWKVMRRWGFFECFYLDHGSGFIANAVAVVTARCGAGIVHGRVKYPEGHGKIERYHQTLIADLLRSFSQNPEIDADCKALELRVEHYLANDYNRKPHEGLDFATPEHRFLSDELPLRPLVNPDETRRYFEITLQRKVSRDNVIKVGGTPYEMPRGAAGKIINVHWHRLDETVSVLHEGRLVKLARVDPIANQSMHRGRASLKEADASRAPVKTAATTLFEKDHSPIVGNSGDYFEET